MDDHSPVVRIVSDLPLDLQTSSESVMKNLPRKTDAISPLASGSLESLSSVSSCESLSLPDTDEASLPITEPVQQPQPDGTESPMVTALRMLSMQAQTLVNVAELYEQDLQARESFSNAIELLHGAVRDHGARLHMCGVGKSGLIAQKLVATLKSLALPACFLHPVEALHGDLGQISAHDVLILVTFSGSTAEILALLPHLRADQAIIVISGAKDEDACKVLQAWNGRDPGIHLPAPTHVNEKQTFGVAAPTLSTTCALAIGDALALCLAERVHGRDRLGDIFARNHPGGSIGSKTRRESQTSESSSRLMRENLQGRLTRMDEGRNPMGPASLATTIHVTRQSTMGEVLLTSYRARHGAVRCVDDQGFAWTFEPAQLRELTSESLGMKLADYLPPNA